MYMAGVVLPRAENRATAVLVASGVIDPCDEGWCER